MLRYVKCQWNVASQGTLESPSFCGWGSPSTAGPRAPSSWSSSSRCAPRCWPRSVATNIPTAAGRCKPTTECSHGCTVGVLWRSEINVKSHGIPNKWRCLKGKSSINGWLSMAIGIYIYRSISAQFRANPDEARGKLSKLTRRFN